MTDIQKRLQTRFFRYLAISSQSNGSSSTVPSTKEQWNMVKLLAEELKAYGLENINIDEHGILTALKRGTKSGKTIGFIAHVDTVDVGLSPDIYPQTLKYEGQNLCLNTQENIWFKKDEHPEADRYIGEEIIFSDGTSVLGADNKAAVSCVMELMEDIYINNIETSDIYVAFVPDEEIGLRGAKLLDLDKFKVDFAYTIDCCEEGELVYETFNAASIDLEFIGVSTHPMSAKNVLINPILMAQDFISCFDRNETPECTEGREGYFYFTSINGNASKASLKMSIRDFDLDSYEKRKLMIKAAVKEIEEKYPRAKVHYSITDVYSNIKQAMGNDTTALDLLYKAFEDNSIVANVIPMRGGTDGSALSKRGIFTPNYFTGALNFHSRFEFLPLSAFEKSYAVTKSLCLLACNDAKS